jgi:hypothetical protein
MKKFIKDNWFRLSIVIILLVAALSATDYFLVILPKQQQQASSVTNNFALQTQCADAAAKYFNNGGYNETSTGLNFSYDDHFNSQMNKCFVLVFSNSPNDNYLSVDLYDALGGQNYADFNGYQNCSPLSVSLIGGNQKTKCEMSSGNIWSDGDDTGSSTYHVGFGGLLHGGVGDENTYTQFMAHIQPFMNN